jgi:hypothetical protein
LAKSLILTDQQTVGSGYTVESQKAGEEKHGGLQIETIPSYEKNLRTWTKGSNVPTDPNELLNFFDSSETLAESLTPAELSPSPGAKPIHHVDCKISDLVDGGVNEAYLSVRHECFRRG